MKKPGIGTMTMCDKRCPVVDTWWQTETGGIMISYPICDSY
jgi:acyl-coenzyme A synthetase/AMP-(fatty) acid ligase